MYSILSLGFRLEDMRNQECRVKEGKKPAPRLTVAYDHQRRRVKLHDEDYPNFTCQMVFGTCYLNYCIVGKHLLELFMVSQ
jgi:hypothetical protein